LLHSGDLSRPHTCYVKTVILQYTALRNGSVWPAPGKESPTLGLHEFQSCSILIGNPKLDLVANKHL